LMHILICLSWTWRWHWSWIGDLSWMTGLSVAVLIEGLGCRVGRGWCVYRSQYLFRIKVYPMVLRMVP
jgi:hypothetical protein